MSKGRLSNLVGRHGKIRLYDHRTHASVRHPRQCAIELLRLRYAHDLKLNAGFGRSRLGFGDERLVERIVAVDLEHRRRALREAVRAPPRFHSGRHAGRAVERPVMLPPGRARLATNPVATGSPAEAMTIGIVCVALFAACTAGVNSATMTLTLSRTNSAATALACSVLPSADRHSTKMFWPSTYP